MSLETDLLLDRRRLKRRLFLWRTVAVLAVLATVLVGIASNRDLAIGGEHIARVTIRGVITEDRRITEAIAAVGREASARALILVIDSPGGTVAGGESLHVAIALVAAKKPVVAVMGGTAASAGYMIAMPAMRIFARESTLTGSIGVKLGVGEVSGLLGWLGITAETIASGALKDEPSLTRRLSEPGRVMLRGLVDDMHDQFVAMVVAGRRMPEARVRELADGRPYTGRQALKLGLVDAIGGEPEARTWLAEVQKISMGMPVRDVGRRGLAERALGESLATMLVSIIKTVVSQGLSLDGAWAVWQAGPDAE